MQRALTRQASYDASRPMLPWLKRMLLRVYLDQRKRALASPEGTHPESFPESGQEPVPATHAFSDPSLRVQDLLARLQDPERTILDRFHLGGDSIQTIAASLALPEGTVKSHLHRARRRLQTTTQTQTPGDRS